MKKSTFSGLDYWRLADELSVIDASFLTMLADPGHFALQDPRNPGNSIIFQIAGWSDSQLDRAGEDDEGRILVDGSKFRAVFKALRNAILANKLQAKITNWARHPEREYYGDYTGEIPANTDEDTRNYGFALSRGIPTVFSNADSITDLSKDPWDRKLFILKEPDWGNTTVEVDELKSWFLARGVAPHFFFPEGVAESFRDRSHPRFSPKLATALAAWEAVRKPSKNKSVKQSLVDWIISNGVGYGLGNADGVVTPTAADEIAKIANWQTSGGATPTYVEDVDNVEAASKGIQNFEQVIDPHAEPFHDEHEAEKDSEIPF